jgi:hypothetical protein
LIWLVDLVQLVDLHMCACCKLTPGISDIQTQQPLKLLSSSMTDSFPRTFERHVTKHLYHRQLSVLRGWLKSSVVITCAHYPA